MLKKFSITLGAFFLIIIIMGLLLSNKYEVKRSVLINAPVSAIHPLVEDLNQWTKWTPWQAADPKIHIQIGEISRGVGASQKWIGKSGSGVLKITRSSPDYGIDYILDMHSDGLNTSSSIVYQTEGTATEVTWTTRGQFPLPIIGTYIALAMDQTAGNMFLSGLNKLKKLAENTDK